MQKNAIMAIRMANRRENADALQKVLTQSGCNIRTRLGLHDAGDVCSNEGLIILQLIGTEEELAHLGELLKTISGLKYNVMEI